MDIMQAYPQAYPYKKPRKLIEKERLRYTMPDGTLWEAVVRLIGPVYSRPDMKSNAVWYPSCESGTRLYTLKKGEGYFIISAAACFKHGRGCGMWVDEAGAIDFLGWIHSPHVAKSILDEVWEPTDYQAIVDEKLAAERAAKERLANLPKVWTLAEATTTANNINHWLDVFRKKRNYEKAIREGFDTRSEAREYIEHFRKQGFGFSYYLSVDHDLGCTIEEPKPVEPEPFPDDDIGW